MDGAEDYESFARRIKSALEKMDSSKYQTVAVVTHGGPIRYIFREILKEGEVEIGDCAFAKLDSGNGELSILELNGIKEV